MEGKLGVGYRVIVPFGRKKLYTGIVSMLTPIAPQGFEVKDIAIQVDENPIVRHPQMKFWQWIADYYLCTPGEVYKAAVPAGLKIESETFISPMSDFEEDPDDRLSERELLVMNALLESGKKRVTLDALASMTKLVTVGPTVNRLLARGAVSIAENLVERYHSKKEVYVRLNTEKGNNEFLHRAFDDVKRAARQEQALLTMVELSGFMRQNLSEMREVSRAELMERAGVTSTLVAAMAKKGIFEIYKKEISRFKYSGVVAGELPTLSDAQQRALKEIHESWHEKGVTLLHGVTSSGKTELYIHLIDDALKQGRQALFLVPEIALTTQLTRRLQKVFGDKVLIYHSKFSDAERVEVWNRMLKSHDPCVVIGARSSVFLPFSHLGLVIVDEEHEPAYKQQDPAPRYNARNAAIVLAKMHGAKTLLGSATPAVETYHHAVNGRYGLVKLLERYDNKPLPKVEMIDMKDTRKRGEVSGTFSAQLLTYVKDASAKGHQSILFLNRRGYAPVAVCKLCGYVPKCLYCDVSLTYHRRMDKLVCHYCGSAYDIPPVCPACKEPGIEVHGYGTERLEEETQQNFGDLRVARMDLDTTRNKDGYENIIDDFSAGKSQVLIGTQMVTKGLDFGNVSLVGVVNSDAIMNFPDFRASERAFNMIEQVAGRAGRKSADGIVAIQSYNPQHPIYEFVKNHDYEGFYRHEIAERQQYMYPPFARVIYIYIKHKDLNTTASLALEYAASLRTLLGNRVTGPDEPPVARVQNQYIRRIMLKIEPSASLSKVKQMLQELRVEYANKGKLSGVTLVYDVDPM